MKNISTKNVFGMVRGYIKNSINAFEKSQEQPDFNITSSLIISNKDIKMKKTKQDRAPV